MRRLTIASACDCLLSEESYHSDVSYSYSCRKHTGPLDMPSNLPATTAAIELMQGQE